MKKKEIESFIELLESKNSKYEAYFGIFQYGGGPDESFIKANKQGLELFAAEILKASLQSEEILTDNEKKSFPIDYLQEWIDGDTYVQYVVPVLGKSQNLIQESIKETIADSAMKYGCILGIIIILISLIVGFITIVSWMF